MSTPPRNRKSRLAGAMNSKGVIAVPSDEPANGTKPPLALAPEPEADETPGEETAVETPATTAPVVEPEQHPDTIEPQVVPSLDPEPVVEPVPEPKTATRKPPLQTARVLAGAGVVQMDPSLELAHLRQMIATGRDQRRYVEDLPRRSDKGTYMRLPVHLQDVLAEYCDRNDAPMADFIAALLDSYFRDIGALPPLGEGNRPVEKFFDKMRKETRTYDY